MAAVKTYQQASAAARAASRRTHQGVVPPHGLIKRYRGSRTRPPCHCNKCRAAWAAYIRERSSAKQSGDGRQAS